MRLAIILIIIFAPITSHAQTTLDDYRQSVEAYSLQLKLSATRVEAARETMRGAHTGFLPRLSLDGNFTATVRHFNTAKHWNFSVLPQLVQTIYGGGSVRAAYRNAELGHDVSLCDAEFSMLDVRYAADYAYWNLSAMGYYLASQREYVGIIRSLKTIVDRRFSEGYISKSDALMIDVRLSEADFQLISAEQNYAISLHNFNILRGSDPNSDVDLSQSIRDSLTAPQPISLDQTLARRPDYRASMLLSERAEVGIRAARAPFNPQLSVSAGGSWQPYYPNSKGTTHLDGSAVLRLSVPIFQWGARRRAVAVARLSQLQSQFATEQLRDAILRDQADGWSAVKNSQAQVEASNQSLRLAAENLTISTYSYGEGLATILDVLQAQLSWISLYSYAIQARYNYAVAISAYSRTTATAILEGK